MNRTQKAFFVLCGLFFTAPALAEESLLSSLTAPSAQRNQWFGDASASVRVQEIPEIGLFNEIGTDHAAITLDPTIVMGGGSLTLGHVFGKQMDPQVWGGRAHVSVSAHYFVGSDDESIYHLDNVNLIYLDGTSYGLYGEIIGSAHTRLQEWGAEVRGGLDFDQGNGWILTPSVAFFGSHSELSQTIGFFEFTDAYYDQLTNEVRNTRWGSSIGIGAKNDLGGGFELLLGAEFGLDYNITNADVTNCGGYNNFPVCAADNFFEQGSVQAKKFGFFANLAAGVGFNLAFAHIAIEGQAGYDSYIPTIDYGNADGEVTEIGEEGDFNYGGGVTVTIPLN